MKKWGLVVTLVYALIVLGLLVPATLLLMARSTPAWSSYKEFYQAWGTWIIAGVFVLGQAVLLGLSVDTTQRRVQSRTPIVLSAVTVGFFLTVITVVVVVAAFLVVWGENKFPVLRDLTGVAATISITWIAWGILFYLFDRNSTTRRPVRCHGCFGGACSSCWSRCPPT